MIREITFLTAVLALSGNAMAINKCTGADGKVSYQEAACASSNSMVVFDRPQQGQQQPPNVMAPGDAARALEDQLRRGVVLDQMDRNTRERQRLLSDAKAVPPPARGDGKVFVGMQGDDVVKVWGNPSRRNQVVTANGATDQWVYPRGAAAVQYVHLLNGVVTSVSTAQLP